MIDLAALAFSFVLGLAAVAATIVSSRAFAPARGYARFAFALYFTLAAANAAAVVMGGTTMPRIAMALTQMVAALGPVALALAVSSARALPPAAGIAGFALAGACFCAIGAVVSGYTVLAFAPLIMSAAAIFIVSLHRWREAGAVSLYAILAACALIAGAACAMNGSVAGSVLFSATALLGFSLALARGSRARVEPQSPRDLRLPSVSAKN